MTLDDITPDQFDDAKQQAFKENLAKSLGVPVEVRRWLSQATSTPVVPA